MTATRLRVAGELTVPGDKSISHRSLICSALADLRARSDERVGVDHRARSDPRADVHVHRRHADHARREVGTAAHGRSAGYEAYSPIDAERLHGIGMLVEERERPRAARADRHVHQSAEPKAEQDPALHPGHGAPRAVGGALRRADVAALERREERLDDVLRLRRKRDACGRVGQREHASDELRIRRAGRDGAHSAPACCNAARTTPSWRGSIGTSGDRRTLVKRPSMDSAALIGMGLVSTLAARMSGSAR